MSRLVNHIICILVETYQLTEVTEHNNRISASKTTWKTSYAPRIQPRRNRSERQLEKSLIKLSFFMAISIIVYSHP